MIKELRHIQLHDMMSYLKAVVASLVLCFTIQGCDKEMGEPESTIDDNAIGFNAGVEKTRAVATIDHVQDNGFKVWGGYINTDGTAQQVFAGTAVTYDDTDGWGYSPAKYWNPGKTYHFFGVYPQDGGTVTPFIANGNLYFTLGFNVPADAGTDLLVATPTPIVATKPYQPVNMGFTHALSKININVQKNGANEDDVVVVHSVSLSNVKKTGKYNSQTGEWGETVAGSLTFSNFSVELSHLEQTQVTSDKLLLPQVIAENSIQLSIYYSISAGNSNDFYTANAYLPISTITQWEQQKIYTYNVTLGAAKNNILFGTPEVQDWKDEKPVGGSIMIQ